MAVIKAAISRISYYLKKKYINAERFKPWTISNRLFAFIKARRLKGMTRYAPLVALCLAIFPSAGIWKPNRLWVAIQLRKWCAEQWAILATIDNRAHQTIDIGFTIMVSSASSKRSRYFWCYRASWRPTATGVDQIISLATFWIDEKWAALDDAWIRRIGNIKCIPRLQ